MGAHAGDLLPAERGEAIAVKARPISHFLPSVPAQARFGAFEFLGGLELSANHPAFGGLSGIVLDEDGLEFVAVTDRGAWISGRFEETAGVLSGLSDVKIGPILGPNGQKLAGGTRDTEAVARLGGDLVVSSERVHIIQRFSWRENGALARAQIVPIPPAAKRLPANAGLESLAVMPARSAYRGALLAFAEHGRGPDEATPGFLIGGPRPGMLALILRDGFDPTDIAFLPDGDLLVLERWYSPLRGVKMRVRRIALAGIAPGARLDGPVLVEADLGYEIDNMEGLAVHLDRQGRTILTLVSDDNFSFLQRTLVLRFAYSGR